MTKGLFVTGTDTGVGKTMVTASLVLALRGLGVNACGMKPIETGCHRRGRTLVPRDGKFLKSVAAMYEPVTAVTPYCLERPLAPLIAAEIEGVSIDLGLVRKRFAKLAEKYDAVIVEGVGGLAVPLTARASVADLAKSLKLPLLIVASPFLGTINHTLLTVSFARRMRIEIAGVVLNYMSPPEGSLAEETNPEALRRLSGVPVLGVLPHLLDTSEEEMERIALAYLDMAAIRGAMGLAAPRT
jgi:dethiobiotin synthetase